MKFNRSALGLVFLISISMAKTIPTPTAISSATEKRSLPQEEPTKPEGPEVPASIAVEAAEEPKQADRTKKSATTTFCVEIRPGSSDGPVKVCDEHNPLRPSYLPQSDPQIHNGHHEHHQESHLEEHHQEHHEEHHEEQLPVFITPPNPIAVNIPNNEGQSFINYPPHHCNQFETPANPQYTTISSPASFVYPSFSLPSQQIIIPSSGSVPSASSTAPFSSCSSFSSLPSGQHLITPSSDTAVTPQQVIIPSSGSITYASTAPSSSSSSSYFSSGQDLIYPSSTAATSQQIIIPSTGSGHCSCPCPSNNGIYPQSLIALFRSSMARNDNKSPMEPSMEMRTHSKKMYTVPINSYYGSGAGGYQAKSPYVVQCHPQVLAIGGGSVAGRSTLVPNAEKFKGKMHQSPMNEEAQVNLFTTQGAGRQIIHHTVEPMIHTSPDVSFDSSRPSVYQQHQQQQQRLYPAATYQTYQNRPAYVSHDSGYMVHPTSHFYRQEETPRQLITWNNALLRNTEQKASSDMGTQQYEEKSWNQQPDGGNIAERATMDMEPSLQKQRGQQPAADAMSPSQKLNKMRGVGSSSGSSSFGTTNPLMQSFPREHETNLGGAMHDEMGKREAEKSPATEIDV